MSAIRAFRPLLLSALAVAFVTIRPVQSQSMPTLPTPERLIGGDAFATDPPDDDVAVHAAPDGRVVVLAVESRTLLTLLSEDGTSFTEGPTVSGRVDERPVFGMVSQVDDTGAVHIVVIDGRDGGFGLSYVRGDDVGRSWTVPVSVIGAGDPSFPVEPSLPFIGALRVATGAGGRIAIGWRGRDDGFWVAVSADRGATWTSPARLDPDATMYESGGLDLAFTAAGTLVYVYTRSAPPFPRDVSTLVVTTSDDLGQSFSEPALLEPDPGLGAYVLQPRVEAAADGSVSVFGAGIRYLSYTPVAVAYRSTDDGSTFHLAFQYERRDTSVFDFVHAAIADDGEALFVFPDGRGGYLTTRSSDHGSNYAAPVALPGIRSSSLGSGFASDRLSDGRWLLGVETTGFPLNYYVIESIGDAWSAPASVLPSGVVARPVSFRRNGGVAALPGGRAIAAVRGGRSDARYAADVFVAAREPNSATWLPGARIDEDGETLRGLSGELRAATDGEWLHVLNWEDDRVVAYRSSDGGRTYTPPVPVADESAAFYNGGDARAAVGSDGVVHVVWTTFDDATFAYRLWHAASRDRGATWSEARIVLDDAGGRLTDDLRLMGGDQGEAYVAWLENRFRTLRLARIDADGATATDLSPPDTTPTFLQEFDACRSGDRLLFLEYEGFSGPRLFARSLELAGGTMSTRYPVQVNNATPDGMRLRCSGDGLGTVAWIERAGSGTLNGTAFARRIDGTAAIAAPRVLDSGVRSDSLELSDSADVGGAAVAAYSKAIVANGRIEGYAEWVTRTDGATLPVRIDSSSTAPADLDHDVSLATDGQGRVWIAWLESTVDGGVEDWLLTSRSDDSGRTWGPVRRVSTARPERVHEDRDPIVLAVLGGAAYLWRGRRAADLAQVVSNVDRVNTAPVADAGPDLRLECDGDRVASATLDGSGSTDPDGDDDIASWTWSVDGDVVAEGETAEADFPLGSSEVTLVVADRAGATGTDAATIVVEDSIAPSGGISFPADGSCQPGEVTVETAFADLCDPALAISFEPDGPTISEHGDHAVTATAMDEAGNASSDAVAFTIDRVAPTVSIVVGALRSLLPSERALSDVFVSGDDDGATGAVVHETMDLAGCRVYDGAIDGDGDGLLSDETVVLDLAEVCRLATRCGWTVLNSPELAVEASDCAGNVGRDASVLPGSLELRPGACGD